MAKIIKKRVLLTTKRKWNEICQHGDKIAISEKYGISLENVSIAFRHGMATPELIENINEYFGLDQEKVEIPQNES